MGIKLSHSAMNKFKTCPASYKLHYKDRIRENRLGSALIFGSAIDEALNLLLESKLDKPTENATDDIEKLKGKFDHLFAFQMINKNLEDIRTSHFVDYFKSDFDEYVLLPDDKKSLETFAKNAGYEETDSMKLLAEINEIDVKKGTELSYYNYASWLSLRRKGHLMIECYKEKIMPLIKRVHSVQKKVILPNGIGDEMIGYIDLEVELEGYGGIITADNKTSSKKYKLIDINGKGQLSIYDEYTENGQGGYIVLIKKMKYDKTLTCKKCGKVTKRAVKSCPEMTNKKRCGGDLTLEKKPYVDFQVIVDKMSEESKDLHFNEANVILNKIKKEEFPQDRDSCFQYGRKCAYYSYCRDGSTEGLVKV